MATVNGQLPLLAIVGIVFFAVIMSVVLQVARYRLRGRRIFRMAPLHHHFELVGWAEEKITVRFWIVAALAGLLGFSVFLVSVNGLPLADDDRPARSRSAPSTDLRGRRAVVLGLARSGVAAARFLADAGAVVAAYDRRPAAELADAVAALGARPVRLALGVDEADARALLARRRPACHQPVGLARFPTTDPWLREALPRPRRAARSS